MFTANDTWNNCMEGAYKTQERRRLIQEWTQKICGPTTNLTICRHLAAADRIADKINAECQGMIEPANDILANGGKKALEKLMDVETEIYGKLHEIELVYLGALFVVKDLFPQTPEFKRMQQAKS